MRRIDAAAKYLSEFLAWLLSGRRQADMPGGGRSFRRRCQRLWEVWPLAPLIDEVHEVVFVDGIHLGRKAVVLIACSEEHVLGWYVARSENSRAWAALMDRIAPPELVVTDGGSGFEKARKNVWPQTRVQWCTFHVFGQITRATTTRPKLPASKELYALGKRLIRICDLAQAEAWVSEYQAWCVRWEAFLAEKPPTPGGGWEYTHPRLVKARNGLNRLASRGVLFTFVDPTWGRVMPAMNNRIEGATNAPLPQVLRDHRGMRLSRRIKAVFWWCYMHTEHPLVSGSDPQNHANRHPDRSGMAPLLTRTRRQRCHPPMGRRHRMARPPPHHPLHQHLRLTPTNTFCPITLVRRVRTCCRGRRARPAVR